MPRPFSLLTNQPLPVITSTSASGNSINSKKSIGAINSKKKEKKNAGNYSQARKQQSPRPDAAKMDIDDSSLSRPQPENAFPTSQILILEGHEAEVFKCHWNPSKSLVATGSGDSTVRIWKIPQDISGSSSVEDPVVLKHFGDGEDPKDVTAIRWDVSTFKAFFVLFINKATGEFLATGSYTGELRLFSPTGDLLHLEREAHNGPIFSVKWNPSANLVITCGVDSSVCLWRLSEKSLKFLGKSTHHSDPVLEVDWKDDHIFASCSSDKSVQICRISEEMINGDFKASDSNAGSWVLRKFENAHEADVNEVKWSPDGKFLASCSDDGTAKIWSLESESYIHELKGHQKEVFTMDWRPGSEENDAPSQYLATASLDHSVRIWDMKDGKCAKEFSKHKEAVYTLSFSPNGHYLATGGYDCEVMVWDFKTGNTIRQYSGISGIFEVAWNSNGEKLIATFAQNTACVFEFKV